MTVTGSLVDRHEFDALVRAHTTELLRYAWHRVKERETAEDLVQLTFIAAWEGRVKFAQQSSPRTWLFSILKNKIADHWRKSYRDPVVHGVDVPDEFFDADGGWRPEKRPVAWEPDAIADNEVLHRYLAGCLQELPDQWRAAMEMKYLKEKEAEEICKELGISTTNYWQRIHRSKLRLRDCITRKLSSTK